MMLFLITSKSLHSSSPNDAFSHQTEIASLIFTKRCFLSSHEADADVSAVHIEVDKETLEMLHALELNDVPGIIQVKPTPVQPQFGFGRGGDAAPRRILILRTKNHILLSWRCLRWSR